MNPRGLRFKPQLDLRMVRGGDQVEGYIYLALELWILCEKEVVGSNIAHDRLHNPFEVRGDRIKQEWWWYRTRRGISTFFLKWLSCDLSIRGGGSNRFWRREKSFSEEIISALSAEIRKEKDAPEQASMKALIFDSSKCERVSLSIAFGMETKEL